MQILGLVSKQHDPFITLCIGHLSQFVQEPSAQGGLGGTTLRWMIRGVQEGREKAIL